MFMMRRHEWRQSASVGVLALLAVALIVPGAARAASTRYAAPTPSGTEDCSSPANACSLKKAAADPAVADGDEVILAAGEYALGEAIEVSKAIDVHGEGAPSATRVVSNTNAGAAITLNNAGAKLRDLEIDYSGVFSALSAAAGTVDRVIAISSTNSGCSVSNTTILDSICVSKEERGVGLGINFSGGSHTIVLRNVTAIGAGPEGHGISAEAGTGATVSIEAKNVIARGNGDDVHAFADATSSTTITLDHSNFSKVFSFAVSGGTSSVTSSAASGNQTAAPTFVDAALGDYHEAAGSVTIDAGVADASNGTLDLDGGARTQGAAIDVGADEFTPPPPPQKEGPAPDRTAPVTSISRHPAGSIRTLRRSVKATFRFGSDDPGAHYECALDSHPFAPCTSPHAVTVKRGHHTFSVRAIDAAGNADQTPAVFKWTVKAKPVLRAHR